MTSPVDISRWSAARARNALRHRGLIGAVALLTAIGTLFLLQILPREAERAVAARVSQLAPAVDTAPLRTQLELLRAELRRTDDALVARRAQQRTESLFAVTIVDPSGGSSVIVGDTLRADLAERRRVAQASRLVESFVALAAAPALLGDARVAVIADSLAEADRALSAFVGAGESDATYRALRTRVNALGDRLVQLVDERLQVARDAAGAPADSAADSATVRLQREARQWRDSVQALETAMRRATSWNDARTARERALRSAAPLRTPLVPVLLASVVLALALGFLVAFLVELRTPRLADSAEVRALVRRADLSTTLVIEPRPRAPLSRRRAADRQLAPVLLGDPTPYQQIHQLLTTMGDAVARVGVRSAAASDTAAVALNLAASAAEASRAALLVDADVVHRQVTAFVAAEQHAGLADVARARVDLASALAVVPTGRDRSLTVLPAGPTITTREALTRAANDVLRLMQRFDLTVLALPQDPNAWPAMLVPTDVVLMVRPGATHVAWLRGALAAAARDGVRVRAVFVSRAALS